MYWGKKGMNLSLGVPPVKLSKSFDILFGPFPLSSPLVFNWFGTALRCLCQHVRLFQFVLGEKKIWIYLWVYPESNFLNLLTYFSDLSRWVLPLFSTDLGLPWDAIVTHVRLIQFVLGEKKVWIYLRGYQKSNFLNLLTYFSDLSSWVLPLFLTDLEPPWDAIVTLIRLVQFVLGGKTYEFIFGCTPSQIFKIFWHTFRTFPVESSPCFQLIWDRLEMPLSHI